MSHKIKDFGFSDPEVLIKLADLLKSIRDIGQICQLIQYEKPEELSNILQDVVDSYNEYLTTEDK